MFINGLERSFQNKTPEQCALMIWLLSVSHGAAQNRCVRCVIKIFDLKICVTDNDNESFPSTCKALQETNSFRLVRDMGFVS